MKLDEKGAVPIPYIIALVLGVIVIALVSYWLFMSGGEFVTTITESSCRAKKMNYCSALEAARSVPAKFSDACPIPDGQEPNYFAPECCNFDWAAGGAEIC